MNSAPFHSSKCPGLDGHPSEAGLEVGKDYRLGREVIETPKSKVGSFEIKGGLVERERRRWIQELW